MPNATAASAASRTPVASGDRGTRAVWHRPRIGNTGFRQCRVARAGLSVAATYAMDRRVELALLGVAGGVAGLVAKRAATEVWNRLIKPRKANHRPKRSWSL